VLIIIGIEQSLAMRGAGGFTTYYSRSVEMIKSDLAFSPNTSISD